MSKPQFHWEDPLLLQDQLTTEERMIADAAREYVQGKLAPRVHGFLYLITIAVDAKSK